MKVENPASRLITVTPSRAVKTTLLMTAVILCLMLFIFLLVRPMRSLYGPLVWYARYDNVPLSRIVSDLERQQIIPEGTVWVDASLESRPVSVRWLLADPDEILRDLAGQAVVTIAYPVGYHGDIIGPVEVALAGPSNGTVVPRIDRQLELRKLGLP